MSGERLDLVFAALADPTRRQLVTSLVNEGARTATVLARDLPMSRQAVLHHLVTLGDAGLARSRRVGREVLWSVDVAPMTGAAAWMLEAGQPKPPSHRSVRI